LKTVAAALGRPTDGVAAARAFHEKLMAIRNASTGRAARRVLLQIGEEPLVVAGGKSFLNAALESVGARNIYGDLKQAYPRPSLEDVLSRNPDDIVVVSMGSAASAAHMAGEWKKLSNLSAVKSEKIHVISGDLLLRPSPRLIEGLRALESSLYGS
jgi:ABC-type Fe3+-hydroxamate transport system substrate-binding protein